MKSCVAIVISYPPYTFHTQTFRSLHLMKDQIEKLYIVHAKNQSLPTLEQDYVSITIEKNDLGYSLNQLFAHVKAEQVLLIGPGSVLTSVEESSGNQHGLYIPTSLIKKVPFLEKHLLPFPEALFSAWMNLLPDHQTIKYSDSIFTYRGPKHSTIKTKQQFASKYVRLTPQHTTTVTVMIANYNNGPYINNAIQSCLMGSVRPTQICIVDDASTDDSLSIFDSWEHPSISTTTLRHNVGKARALNHILPSIHTPYILELDADDWLDPDAFFHITKWLEKWPSTSPVLYGNIRTWKQAHQELLFKSVATGKQIHTASELLQYKHPIGPRIYRTQALKDIGGFPVIKYEDGRLYEDVSACYQLLKQGPLLYQPFTVYNSRSHENSITKKNPSKWEGYLKQMEDF